AKASWLKEFYKVDFTVFNLAPAPFVLRGGSARLDVPDGLSLAPTAVPQSRWSEVLDVPAGGQATTSWLLRGDDEGFYDLSATYTGVLEPTGLPVTSTARTSTPVHVWGASALRMTVTADDRLDQYAPYRVRAELKNVADVPLYNLRL